MAHGHMTRPAVVTTPKSLWLALVLAALLGPFGLFYATVPGAMLMLIAAIVLAIFTFGIGLFLVWPLCVVWAVAAVRAHNRKTQGGGAGAPQVKRQV